MRRHVDHRHHLIRNVFLSLGLAGTLVGSVQAALTETQPQLPVPSVPIKPGPQASSQPKLTPAQEAALAEVRKILQEARHMAESIELPSRLTTRGMVLKDLQASKDRLINEIEEAQFRIGDFSNTVTTKQPRYLAFAQVNYGKIQEAVATAAQIKLGVDTSLALVKMLADARHLDAGIKVAETDLAKEQVPSNRYMHQAAVWALIASEQAKVGDSTARASMERALKAANALSDPKRFKPLPERIVAWVHVAKAQAALGDKAGSAESFRQAIQVEMTLQEVKKWPEELIMTGKAQIESGDTAAGQGTLQQVIQLSTGLEPLGRAGLLGCIAWTKSVTGNEQGAGQLLDQAVRETTDLPPSQRVRVLHDLGKWQLGLHQQEAAVRTVRLMKAKEMGSGLAIEHREGLDSRLMARPLRLEFPGAVYHVTSRGNARQDIVLDDRDRTQFLTLLAHVIERYGWLCHAYCLMDNHYHLLLETPQPTLSLGMRQLNGRYTQAYNRRHARVGHLLQGRFTAILVEKEAHLLELCRYVVLNPVRANMVPHPRQWAWSSYRATVGETSAPAWLTTDWILGQFGARVGAAQERYRTFVAEGRGGPRPWEQLTGQIYLGSEAFVAQHQPNRVIRDIPRRQTQAQRPTLRVLFQRKGEQPRLIHVAYRQYGYRLAEIAEHLGVHAATVSRRLKHAEQDNV